MSTILSVGIDIGTSTTQVIFSRITMDNTAGYFTAPRISIVDKEIVFRSRVYPTPLRSPVLIDGSAVKEIVEAEFRSAGYRPEQVDTGAVIVTGETARKENAKEVLEHLSSFAGEFVVSTAGPDLESVIAGKGSGAFQYSIDEECSVLNLDIGGGTTNIVAFDNGDIRGKACFDIGGRQIRVDEAGRITYISESAKAIAGAVGVSLQEGDTADVTTLTRITDKMAELLAEAVGLKTPEALLERVRTAKSARMEAPAQRSFLCFSGGVGECLAEGEGRSEFAYGDIGVLLARSIRNCQELKRMPWIEAKETITATVIGAGTHTMSLSGSTISYSPKMFPLKNIPVLKLSPEEEAAVLRGDGQTLRKRVQWFLEQSDSSQMLLAFHGPGDPDYGEVKEIAATVVNAMNPLLEPDVPIIVIVESDIAKALGIAMRATGCRRKMAAIDSVKVEDHDFLDIGAPLMDGLVVPVVVKTLVFG